jgi:hypothetical protein
MTFSASTPLLDQAQREGLIDAEEFACFTDVRRLRNKVLHGALRPSFPPSGAVEMVEGPAPSHRGHLQPLLA